VVIRQGDVFWVDLTAPHGSGPGYRHPYVVVQNNIFNKSKLQTVVVCALTSTLERAAAPGNVLLSKDEANLPKRSVVNITQVLTLDKDYLQNRIGALSKARVQEIIDGISMLLEPRDV
jgi:mRNA interferase MazF